jgi:hypothetical protein
LDSLIGFHWKMANAGTKQTRHNNCTESSAIHGLLVIIGVKENE